MALAWGFVYWMVANMKCLSSFLCHTLCPCPTRTEIMSQKCQTRLQNVTRVLNIIVLTMSWWNGWPVRRTLMNSWGKKNKTHWHIEFDGLFQLLCLQSTNTLITFHNKLKILIQHQVKGPYFGGNHTKHTSRVFYLCSPNKLHDNIHISQTTHEINGYQTGLVVPVSVWKAGPARYAVVMTEEQVARHDGKSWPYREGGVGSGVSRPVPPRALRLESRGCIV